MKTRLFGFILAALITSPLFAQENLLQKELLVNYKYMLLPVDRNVSKSRISFLANDFDTYFDIRLASHMDSVDYWVFMHVEQFMN